MAASNVPHEIWNGPSFLSLLNRQKNKTGQKKWYKIERQTDRKRSKNNIHKSINSLPSASLLFPPFLQISPSLTFDSNSRIMNYQTFINNITTRITIHWIIRIITPCITWYLIRLFWLNKKYKGRKREGGGYIYIEREGQSWWWSRDIKIMRSGTWSRCFGGTCPSLVDPFPAILTALTSCSSSSSSASSSSSSSSLDFYCFSFHISRYGSLKSIVSSSCEIE